MRQPIWQVIAVLFIVQRVTNKSTLTNNTTASGRIGEFKDFGELWVGVETTVNFRRDKV